MVATTVAEKFMTLEEYIEFEKTSESKHEYRDGKLYEMAGGRFNHNDLAGQFLTLLRLHFGQIKSPCKALGSDQKIYIGAVNRGVYPDVVVVCGKREFHDKGEFLLTNPLLIVEVLSKGTQSYDKGDKFDLYCSLPSFQEYVLVSQDKPSIQVRYLQDPENDLWKITRSDGLDATIYLHSLNLELSLRSIYSVIEKFSEEED